MRGGCREHRKWMILLGLQLQLKNNSHDLKIKEELEKKIMKLEKELGLD